MNDLDKAIAAAREAQFSYARAIVGEHVSAVVEAAKDRIVETQRDLLAALDAARGKAIATVRSDTGLTLTADRLKHYRGQRVPCGALLYAAPPAAADSLRSMSDWLESGEYRVSFNGDESYPLLIGGALYAPGKPPRVVFECEQAPPAADEALADTQRAIIEAAERRGYERGIKEAPPAAAKGEGNE